MEREELIEDEIYFQHYSNQNTYIFKYRVESSKDIGYKCYIWVNGKTFTASSSGVNGNDYSQVRQATPLEKAWLQECIKQGKFVTLDNVKINNNYRLWKLKVNC